MKYYRWKVMIPACFKIHIGSTFMVCPHGIFTYFTLFTNVRCFNRLHIYIYIYIFFFFSFLAGLLSLRDLPNQGLNVGPWQWRLGVLITRLPGKFLFPLL